MTATRSPAFGELLRRSRRALGLTQEELAERAGVSARLISALESGASHRPRKDTLQLLMEALELTEEQQKVFVAAARRAGPAVASEVDDDQGARAAVPSSAIQTFLMTRSVKTNLPAEPNLFIGRKHEIEGITSLLRRDDVRLVTLTGPGGTGKTRLAVQVARRLEDAFLDGIFFVSLTAVSEPGLVPSAIATALGVRETDTQSSLDALKEYLRGKRILLLLDSFEHLLDAAPHVGELLASADQLSVLATSRAVLHLAAEREFPVPPLPAPDPECAPDVDTVIGYDAVRLFVDRSQAANPSFAVTAQTAAVLAKICARLEGLALALELAATRIRVFSPQALHDRLSSRLGILTGGHRDLPTRHQTLRSTIDWSYNLLSAHEQVLFRRLAIFAGGCPLDAVAAVCDAERDLGIDVLDGVAGLIEKSLLQRAAGGEGEPRYRMLDTIHEYALECLAGAEKDTVQRHHTEYFLMLAELAAPELQGPNQTQWLGRLELDYPNICAALQCSLDNRDADTAFRFGAALWRFWEMHSRIREGRTWLEAILPVRDAVDARLLARGLAGAGNLAFFQGDYERAIALFDECLTLRRSAGDVIGVANALSNLGLCALYQGRFDHAVELHQESLTLREESGDAWGIATSLGNLALVALYKGNYPRATMLHEEALARWRELGDDHMVATMTTNLGNALLGMGEVERAIALQQESLALFERLGNKNGITWCLEGLACAAVSQKEIERAASLWGAAEALRREIGTSMPPNDRAMHDQYLAIARDQIDDAAYTAAWEAGQAMSIENVIAFARRLDLYASP